MTAFTHIAPIPLAVLMLVAASNTAGATEQCLAYDEPIELGKVSTSRLPETSGLVVSHKNPWVMWVHNDSEGDNRIYALALDGEYLGRWKLHGVSADDCEDIAYGPCADGSDGCLYLGDFGNNEGQREKFQIYRMEEPEFDFGEALDDALNEDLDADQIEKIKFRYPNIDGDDETPDTEAMMVDAEGTIYLFTKSRHGAEVLTLEVPDDLDDRVTARSHGVREDFFRATGADLARSGDHFVVRNLEVAREFTLGEGQGVVDAFLNNTYVTLAVGHEKQGEAIGYTADGRALLTTSERHKEPVYLYECAVLESSGKEDGVGGPSSTGGTAEASEGCSVGPMGEARHPDTFALVGALLLGLTLRRRRG